MFTLIKSCVNNWTNLYVKGALTFMGYFAQTLYNQKFMPGGKIFATRPLVLIDEFFFYPANILPCLYDDIL